MNITIDQLRNILFHVDNQEMTVKELRHQLFKIPDENIEYDNSQDFDLIFRKNKI